MSAGTQIYQENFLKREVSAFLTPENISSIAIRCGYNSQASFQPGEFADLLEKTTSIFLKKVQGNYPLSYELKERVRPIIEEELSKMCHRAPQDLSYPPVTPEFFQRWITSAIYWLSGGV